MRRPLASIIHAYNHNALSKSQACLTGHTMAITTDLPPALGCQPDNCLANSRSQQCTTSDHEDPFQEAPAFNIAGTDYIQTTSDRRQWCCATTIISQSSFVIQDDNPRPLALCPGTPTSPQIPRTALHHRAHPRETVSDHARRYDSSAIPYAWCRAGRRVKIESRDQYR